MDDDKRIVAWIDADEFSEVASYVYSCETSKLHLAWQVIRVWLCRMPSSKIPRSIVCTFELLNAYFEHSSQSMALALMRFVSLLSSESQDRERPNFALPILSLSRMAGLPSWLADLRNDIAHGIIPSVGTLESAFWWSLKYLGEFWTSNVKYNEVRISEVNELLKSHNLTVIRYVDNLLQGKQVSQSDTKEVFKSRLSPTCFQLITNSICGYGCELLTGDLSLSNIVRECAIKLRCLLDALLSQKLIGELVLQFILGLDDDCSVETDIRLEWCITWIEAIGCHGSEKSILCNYVNGLVFDWRIACSHIMGHMCDKFRGLFVRLLAIRDPPVSQGKIKAIMNHIDVFCGGDVSKEPQTNESHTVTFTGNHWKRADSLLWAEKPFGALISSCSNFFSFTLVLACNAQTNRQHKGVPPHDSKGGRQIC
ncbi:ribosomal biogenesis protein LAS1 [Schistosoma japonicum]|nr:ribosomal biogenesis protein LAS1 [Schistosoma japonicum]KAH8866735.1 ribosomal biogenesis protein LAS1 [Schistosoma japonicum]KAH8866736.1 ribosomal biogenesis protein LAS1 [Schistosoma japonicum]KAH8866737.1 ribosomal biogenesis protein LAS1 [Schistosoma japonicum]KAH8866738.1 ribosomal biogenesis protein LAS1 [Schistosoma japonicum]